MKSRLSFLCALLTVPFAISPVSAQETGWDYTATIYAWAPTSTATVATPKGSVTAELSFSDAFDALNFAFMGVISAQRDKLSFVVDSVYFDLSDDIAKPNLPGFTSAGLGSQIRLVSGYALWQVAAPPGGRLDVGAGLRFTSVSSNAVLRGPTSISFSLKDSWVDPVLALRYRATFGPRWYGLVFSDFGIAGESDKTWQAVASVGYSFNDKIAVEAGYRVLESERSWDGNTVDARLSGPVVGVTWRF